LYQPLLKNIVILTKRFSFSFHNRSPFVYPKVLYDRGCVYSPKCFQTSPNNVAQIFKERSQPSIEVVGHLSNLNLQIRVSR